MAAMIILKMVSGILLLPIAVGESALICKEDGLMRTTPVAAVEQISPEEVRFMTRNTRYILKVVPMGEKEAVLCK